MYAVYDGMNYNIYWRNISYLPSDSMKDIYIWENNTLSVGVGIPRISRNLKAHNFVDKNTHWILSSDCKIQSKP